MVAPWGSLGIDILGLQATYVILTIPNIQLGSDSNRLTLFESLV